MWCHALWHHDPVADGGARRILVYGVTGSGKTSLARAIGQATGLPWHSADDEIGWLPGWTERDRADQRRIAREICAADTWVLDTAYGAWIDLALARVEVVVALDYPRWFSLQRLVRRTVVRAATRREICNGNTETWAKAFSRDSIIVWHARTWGRKRARIREWVRDPQRLVDRAAGDGPALDRNPPQVVHLRTARATREWLRTLGPA